MRVYVSVACGSTWTLSCCKGQDLVTAWLLSDFGLRDVGYQGSVRSMESWMKQHLREQRSFHIHIGPSQAREDVQAKIGGLNQSDCRCGAVDFLRLGRDTSTLGIAYG